ncbi:aminoglycoside adenylyltransferase domain-containing protein [Paenibacillus sp. BC26]|uniref:aminoglycoside adenylyltransferase domain-containing protein n=1 Tax=Paenibacillus sp. BC26 TaxID=1881032 RepID=UPI0008EE9D91|nr:aminoglycoside adenylyltransferase domain-containing protein [Paenibacillus sp. BC26]SFT08072.1 streptomycin 3-adenylyltransferase [Paenibacillus sp. BC26]
METDEYLHQITTMFHAVLKESLAGVYLHGSLAMGCFNPKKSDIDLIVVVTDKLTRVQQKEIINRLLILHDELPSGRGIELSILLEAHVQEFVHPSPFELHYSDYHRERYRTDEDYICGGFTDDDLAAHLTVTYQRGITLYGRPIQDMFQPIDRSYYLQSILNDISSAAEEISDSPTYFTLNMCRVLMFLREDFIASKKEGGEWALQVLPLKFHPVLTYCLEDYSGITNEFVGDKEAFVAFAEYMSNEINRWMGP